ncbi:MAG: DUF2513 domain-containing protein [Betaproteobacteria bacterium]|nr:DUF2513 domain-containing protein [Betaproteobacteria bacterium]
MKRDMDIVRAIILATRDSSGPLDGVPDIPDEVFAAHVELMAEAGLVKAASVKGLAGPGAATVLRLTWDGQDFADEITDPTIWEKATQLIRGPGSSWTFSVLRDVLKDLIVSVVKQHV